MSALSSTTRGARRAGAGATGPRWVPLACLLVTGALLGLSTNVAKLAGEAGLAPLALLAWSVLGAALLLGAVAALRGDPPPVGARALEYYAVAAFVTVAASNLVFFSAVPEVGASFVALAIAFPPLLTWVGALLLGMERFDRVRGAGVLAALAGAAWLALRELSAPDAPAGWIALTLVGPVLLAVGNLYRTLRWPPGASAESLAPGMLGAAALMLLAAGALPGLSLAVPTDRALPAALVAVQTVLFAAQFTMLFVLQARGGPVYLSLLGSVGAVVAVPVATLALGEAPPRGLAVGAALIALGVGLLTWGGARAGPRRRAAEPAGARSSGRRRWRRRA